VHRGRRVSYLIASTPGKEKRNPKSLHQHVSPQAVAVFECKAEEDYPEIEARGTSCR